MAVLCVSLLHTWKARGLAVNQTIGKNRDDKGKEVALQLDLEDEKKSGH